MKSTLRFLLAAIALAASAGTVVAALLGASPDFPRVAFTSTSTTSLTYDPSSQLFAINPSPSAILFAAGEPPRFVTGTKSLVIKATVNNAGAFVSGVVGDDFVLTGTVVRGATTYTGVLLSGEVSAFGYLESGSTDQYDFRLVPTGGQLLSFYATGASVDVTSETSTFANDFSVAFNGKSKGTLGFESAVTDNTPPVITCPTDIVIECNANSGGLQGAFITYPPVTVTDDTDPNPTIVFNPASGSFFELPAGEASATYPVTITATDAAGNTSTCTFLVAVQDTMPPEFDSLSPILAGCVDPIVLPNDAGQCLATYTFTLPIALDACFTVPTAVPVTVSAVDEFGATITLTDLGNGQVQGLFPVNKTSVSVLTFVADDGRGNTVQAQCELIVEDVDGPTLACVDQTATFKPIMTRALSCITDKFGCNEIKAGSTLWFNSVINTPSDHKAPFTIRAYDQSIELSVDGEVTVIPVPEAYVTIQNGAITAMTTFVNGQWQTVSKAALAGNVFLAGVAYTVPEDIGGCRNKNCHFNECHDRRGHGRGSRSKVTATWCARFDIDKPAVFLKWGWASAVYSQFSQDYSTLGVKPVDSQFSNPYNNRDAAGSPENFKQFVVSGSRGDGRWCKHGRNNKYTGELTELRRANMGVGSTCMGSVVFDAPLAADNCDDSVEVTITPPSGSVFGPGNHVITATATDASGNASECSFTLTVLSPLQVVFESPSDDNLNDNTRQEDEGWSDFNAPDDASTPQIINRFCVGDNICHLVRLLDCNGDDVTSQMAGAVTVHIDVTEREGAFANSEIVTDVVEQYVGVGSPGSLMVPFLGRFKYCLETENYTPGTQNTPRFYRSTVWVEYNSSPGIPVGMEDVILESQ